MKDLVFLKPRGAHIEPYTTDEIIADCAGVKRTTVMRLIRKHEKDLEEFGLLGFEIRAVKRERGIKHKKIYHFNEQQATLFITYLQNTPPVRQFKKDLVRQFYAMREELQKRKVLRAEGKTTRRSLTDALRDSGEDNRLCGHGYAVYTNLIYKSLLGKNAAQLRKERGADRQAVAKDFLTSDELPAYEKKEAAVAVLLDAGLRYEQIKPIILENKKSRSVAVRR